MAWEDIVAQKRKEVAEKIPKKWWIPALSESDRRTQDLRALALSYLSKEEQVYVQGSATQAVANLRSGKWKSYDLTLSLCHAAAVSQQLFNCLTVVMFEEALVRAKALDDQYARDPQSIGALHGLPISLKDCFCIEGYDSTIGFVSRCNKPVKSGGETEIVKQLRAAGAVFYVKTNTPMGMRAGETHNNIFGETCNPYNPRLTPGGSSGGESALISSYGSLMGLGTDIAGSVRLPAAFCGLYGIKVSFGRLPGYGIQPSMPGQDAVFSTHGPMSRSIEDVELYCKWVASTQPWRYDPKAIPMSWTPVHLDEKMAFAVVRTDGITNPLPPVKRGLQIVVDSIRAAGHEVIEFDMDDIYEHGFKTGVFLF